MAGSADAPLAGAAVLVSAVTLLQVCNQSDERTFVLKCLSSWFEDQKDTRYK